MLLPANPLTDILTFPQSATSINFSQKAVTLDGGETIEYDKLIIATGGQPKILPIEGAKSENVYTLRGVEDTKKIDAGKCTHYIVLALSASTTLAPFVSHRG